MDAHSSRQILKKPLFWGAFLILSGILIVWGWLGVANELAFRHSHLETTATVIDSRIIQGNSSEYQLRCNFSLHEGETLFSYSDSSGRHDLWCSLPKDEWDKALSTGEIEVSYLPKNPWVNRPVNAAGGNPLVDNFFGLLLGITLGTSSIYRGAIPYFSQRAHYSMSNTTHQNYG